jgi:hypothetical protein
MGWHWVAQSDGGATEAWNTEWCKTFLCITLQQNTKTAPLFMNMLPLTKFNVIKNTQSGLTWLTLGLRPYSPDAPRPYMMGPLCPII